MGFWQLLIILLFLGFVAFCIQRWGGKFLEAKAQGVIIIFIIVVMVLLILDAFGIFNLIPNVPMPHIGKG